MRNDTTLLAGLTEREANEALCRWLSKRCPQGRTYTYSTACYPIQITGGAFYANAISSFHSSHDSMQRVLDAMTEEEKWDYGWALQDMGGTVCGETCPVLMAFMTPAQKTTAALRALGLGKEPS